MIISFFEEFPTKQNLDKINLINFPTKIYLASKSLDEFKKLKSTIKSKYVKEIIYWPILSLDEGYWLSSFTKRSALLRVMKEAEKQTIMWDAENPVINEKLFITRFLIAWVNKYTIRNFIYNQKKKIYIAEVRPLDGIKYQLMRFGSIGFTPNKYIQIIKMQYPSMMPISDEEFKDYLKKAKQKYKENFIFALGVIAKGILGNEKILTAKQLDHYLNLSKGIKEIIIFRLGGLNKEYLKVIKKYV